MYAIRSYYAQILVSDHTFRKLRGTYRSRVVDNVIVKGKTQPIAVHEILDFHDEESFPKLPEFLQLYRLAMDQYRGRRFKEAAASFEEAMRLRANDRVCAIYVERARHYVDVPPSADWDGVWTLTEK